MINCQSVERLIGRAAGAPALNDAERRELDAHLDGCPSCRAALDVQQQVAGTLRARRPVDVTPRFAARLAERLDREDGGWLQLANWRAWSVGLAPIAAALVLLACLSTPGTSSESTTATTTQSPAATVTFDNLLASNAHDTPAAVFLQPSASGDLLLESVLIGGAVSGDGSYVR